MRSNEYISVQVSIFQYVSVQKTPKNKVNTSHGCCSFGYTIITSEFSCHLVIPVFVSTGGKVAEVDRWKKSLEAEDSTSKLVSSDKIKSAGSSWNMQPVSIVLKDLLFLFLLVQCCCEIP